MSDRNPLAYTGRISGSTTVQGDVQLNPVDFSVNQGIVSSSSAVGQATLVSGTVTIANTTLGATDRIFITRADENSSTALGSLTITAQTASTSFIVTALDPADGSTTITGDVSIINYMSVKQG